MGYLSGTALSKDSVVATASRGNKITPYAARGSKRGLK